MADSVTIKGADKVLAMLRALPDEVLRKGGNAIRAGVRDGLKVIKAQAEANLDAIIAEPNKDGRDVSTGTLKASLRISRGKMPPGVKGESYRFGVKRGAKYPETRGEGITAAQIARQLEAGTENRAPMPWIRPAFELRKAEAAQVAVNSISAKLDSIIARLAR